ncbi:response regulator transcription factor [Anaerolineales bacterium HSG6]|nr:response regulator transcription factor [Anaerolineales bacterium HSG6]MDM8532545.1 response regulator transcription factor [Anaerolineales bacterium HSG25]
MFEEKIRILLVDDHAVVRKGLMMVLRMEPDFEIIGEAENGVKALEFVKVDQPDFVLLDFMMPEMDGAATGAALKANYPNIKVMLLTGIELDDRVLDMLAAGVDGYVIKDIEPHDLAEAIRTVVRGEAYLHPTLARRVLSRMTKKQKSPPKPKVRLTPREKEVLRWMATPATYRQIAEKLFVGEETIRSHAKHILSKLQQPNRAQSVLAAARLGLIELPKD